MLCVSIRCVETRDASVIADLMQGLGFGHTADEIERRLNLAPDRSIDPAYLAETASGRSIGLLAVHIAPLLFYPRPLVRITTLVVAALDGGWSRLPAISPARPDATSSNSRRASIEERAAHSMKLSDFGTPLCI